MAMELLYGVLLYITLRAAPVGMGIIKPDIPYNLYLFRSHSLSPHDSPDNLDNPDRVCAVLPLGGISGLFGLISLELLLRTWVYITSNHPNNPDYLDNPDGSDNPSDPNNPTYRWYLRVYLL